MITETNQDEYRADFIKDIEKQAWRHRANAAFDETKIPEVEAIRQAKLDGLNKDGGKRDLLAFKEQEIEKIDVECATFPHRKERTDEQKDQIRALREKQNEIKKECARMAQDIAADEEFIVGCDDTIAMINKTVQDYRTKAAQLMARAKFAVDFKDTTEEAKVAEVTADAPAQTA